MDAHQLTKWKNCVITLGKLNNCQRLWDVNYQSPTDLWSLAISHCSHDSFWKVTLVSLKNVMFSTRLLALEN